MQNISDITGRITNIEGHLRGVRQMAAENKSCDEIILQLYAVEKSINKVAKDVIKAHLNSCVAESIKSGETTALEGFNYILEKFL